MINYHFHFLKNRNFVSYMYNTGIFKDNKFMYIPNDDKQNYLFYKIKLFAEKFAEHYQFESSNQNSI